MEVKFDNCFKSKGGILKIKNSRTENILRVGNEFINHIKTIYPNLPSIHFNIIENNVINASAKKFENIFFIGINVGTLNLIDDLFLKIQSSKPLKSEDFPKLNLKNSSKGLEYDPLYDPTILSFSKRNLNLASQQARIVTKFIIYHEICHILRGHLGLVANNFNLSINEINDIDDIDIINVLQTLEMDADSFATNRSINDLLEKRIPNQDAKNSIFKDLETFTFHYAYSVYCFFRIFGFYNLDISNIKSKSHPEPAYRISMILDNIATIMIDRNIPNIHNILSGTAKAIGEAETDLNDITFFDNQIKRVLEIYNNEKLIDYKYKILSNWKEVKPKLEKYSYGKLPK